MSRNFHFMSSLVVLAGNIYPVDVISHIPVYCEDRNIPYIFVPTKVCRFLFLRFCRRSSVSLPPPSAPPVSFTSSPERPLRRRRSMMRCTRRSNNSSLLCNLCVHPVVLLLTRPHRDEAPFLRYDVRRDVLNKERYFPV